MREVKRKNKCAFGYNELTRRVFLIRGETQEDVTKPFKAFTEPLYMKIKDANKELLEALTALHAVQNGPPLERDAEGWRMAMTIAEDAIEKARGEL